MSTLSKRVNSLSESETLAMTRKSRELKNLGHNVINLSIGEPDFFTPDYIKEAAKKAIDDNYSFYPPVAGYQDLREVICSKLKNENNLIYTPDQIVVSTGAKQSIANAVLAIVDPGDEVIVPSPYWVSYREIIKLAEGIPVYIPTSIETNFKVTPSMIEKNITSKTKLIIYSSPCNPSGSVYNYNELKDLSILFEKYPNIFIISDEIYEKINFTENPHYSIAQFNNIKEQVILINGVSKGYAMTGWRLGYMAAQKTIAQACDKIQGQFTSATSSISQRAAIAALSQQTNDIKNMVKQFKIRRDHVIKLLNEIPGIKTNIPDGAFYVFPDISYYFGKSDGSTTINDSNDLAMYILNNAHVALVPGSAFGNNNCIRFSYATSIDLLTEAINRTKIILSKLK